jgi:ribosomal-protein-alanine N-acetyltransferase
MVRRADSCDLENIVNLCEKSATAAHWPKEVYSRILQNEEPRRQLLVAEEVGELCGVLVALCSAEEWELENIVVASHRQLRGIGRALLKELIIAAEQANAESILLEVRKSNIAARKLYQSCGFEETGTRKSYYSNPLEDAVVMKKKIENSALEIS